MKTSLQRIKESADFRNVLDTIAAPAFSAVCEAVLLDFYRSTSALTSNAPDANWFRLEGARMFMERLLSIAQPESPKPRPIRDNLES